jgi:hypothetical protein
MGLHGLLQGYLYFTITYFYFYKYFLESKMSIVLHNTKIPFFRSSR